MLLHYPAVQGRPSLAWETIGAMTHMWLVLSGFLQSACIFELPLYSPSVEEQSSSLLYAANVRSYMVCTIRCRNAACGGGESVYVIACASVSILLRRNRKRSACMHGGGLLRDASFESGDVVQLKWAAKLGLDIQQHASGLVEKRAYHSILRDKYAMEQK